MKRQFLLLFVVTPMYLSAQPMLSKIDNTPRPTDRLIKQQVDYLEPGDSGLNIVWDFSQLNPVNDKYELKYESYSEESDTIMGKEHQTMYYYRLTGDTLHLLGYENPTTLITYNKPEVRLVYPLPYKRAITEYFEGAGNYSDCLSIRLQGISTVTNDAVGKIVLPGGDTLQHVIRVHTSKKMVEQMYPILPFRLKHDTVPYILNKDSIDFHLSKDSIRLEIDTWCWYAEGYRYPVFESIQSVAYRFNEAHSHFNTSFYYPPHEQYYGLRSDPDNQQKRDVQDEKQYQVEESSKNNLRKYHDEIIQYAYHMDSDGNIHLNYKILEDAVITISLFDLQGRQLANPRTKTCPAGEFNEILPLNQLPSGEYLLRLTVGEKVYGEIFMK